MALPALEYLQKETFFPVKSSIIRSTMLRLGTSMSGFLQISTYIFTNTGTGRGIACMKSSQKGRMERLFCFRFDSSQFGAGEAFEIQDLVLAERQSERERGQHESPYYKQSVGVGNGRDGILSVFVG
jgi:hypothetical protein